MRTSQKSGFSRRHFGLHIVAFFAVGWGECGPSGEEPCPSVSVVGAGWIERYIFGSLLVFCFPGGSNPFQSLDAGVGQFVAAFL